MNDPIDSNAVSGFMSNTLKTLAMDSTSPVGSIALLAGPHLLAQDSFQGAEGHVVLLPQRLAQLLTQVAYSCANLDLIAVTIGPGSFAGVRIALACAKGISLAHRTPVVGISNLDLLAAGTGRQQGWVSVVIDARRGEIFAALYRLEDGVPSAYKEVGVALSPKTWATTLAAMPELYNTQVCLTGSGLGSYAAVFRGALADRFAMAPESTWATDPLILGQLGQKIFLKQGDASQSALLEPIRADASMLINYQRRPEAEERKYGNLCISDP